MSNKRNTLIIMRKAQIFAKNNLFKVFNQTIQYWFSLDQTVVHIDTEQQQVKSDLHWEVPFRVGKKEVKGSFHMAGQWGSALPNFCNFPKRDDEPAATSAVHSALPGAQRWEAGKVCIPAPSAVPFLFHIPHHWYVLGLTQQRNTSPVPQLTQQACVTCVLC